MLTTAWEGLPDDQSRLWDCLNSELKASSSLAANAVQSEANNAHSATAFMPGDDRFSTTETSRAWNQLVKLYRATNQYLAICAQNGFDAFQIIQCAQWPTFLKVPLTGDAAIIVDLDGNWARLCLKYMVDPGLVVNQALQNEYAIWMWMMESLVPVFETRADRRFLYLGNGGYIT
jgi:hypothetical protein